MKVKRKLLTKLAMKTGSLKNVVKFFKPINFIPLKPEIKDHLVKLRIRENNTGPKTKIKKPKKLGRINTKAFKVSER